MISRRTLFAAALFAALAAPAFAEGEASIASDAARPAVGEWVGQVSWNDSIVTYAWAINPDGAFTSGRVGRGHGGGGAWGMRGARVTLKYDNGVRYEGELHDDSYAGSAYRANHRALGAFSMWRALKRPHERDGVAN